MYQSPISLIQKDVESKIDDAVIKTIQKFGVEVDREELIRAMMYDRKQYEKGYRDGLSDAVKHGKWELVDEAEPMRYGCSECKKLSYTQDNYCSYCGAAMVKK